MRNETEPERLVDANKVGEFLDVPPRTVLELARAGTIPRVKLTGKVIRFKLSAVVAALDSMEGGK